MTGPMFRRIVVTGPESSGKTTLSKALAAHLHWAWTPEAARTHEDVLNDRVSEDTLDDLHDIQTKAANQAFLDGHPGVVCDTGDLVLRMWSEVTRGTSWHPLTAAFPPVHLHVLCPALDEWEEDPLRSMPNYADRVALENMYRQHLELRPHVVAEGRSLDERLSSVLEQWPW